MWCEGSRCPLQTRTSVEVLVVSPKKKLTDERAEAAAKETTERGERGFRTRCTAVGGAIELHTKS